MKMGTTLFIVIKKSKKENRKKNSTIQKFNNKRMAY